MYKYTETHTHIHTILLSSGILEVQNHQGYIYICEQREHERECEKLIENAIKHFIAFY